MAHYYEELDDSIATRHAVVNAAASKREGREILRPSNVKDYRKWMKEGRRVYPSVTTINSHITNSRGLVIWEVDEHLTQAYKIDPKKYKTPEEYIEVVRDFTAPELDKAKTVGTDYHKKLELLANGKLPEDDEDHALCEKAFNLAKEITGANDFLTEKRFVCKDDEQLCGYGGSIDLVVKNKYVLDYKTKMSKKSYDRMTKAYPEQLMQLAAYCNAVLHDNWKAALIVVCIETGECKSIEVSDHELRKAYLRFNFAQGIWQLDA